MKNKITNLINDLDKQARYHADQEENIAKRIRNDINNEDFRNLVNNIAEEQLYKASYVIYNVVIDRLQAILEEAHDEDIVDDDLPFDENAVYLTDDEYKYLSNLIKTAEIDVSTIAKLELSSATGPREYISISYLIYYADTTVTRQWNLPPFVVGEKFKEMQLNQFYTKEELGL